MPSRVSKPSRTKLLTRSQIRQSHVWLEPNQNVRVIGHAMDGDELLALPGHDASDLLMQFLLALRADQVPPSLDGEDVSATETAGAGGHAPRALLKCVTHSAIVPGVVFTEELARRAIRRNCSARAVHPVRATVRQLST